MSEEQDQGYQVLIPNSLIANSWSKEVWKEGMWSTHRPTAGKLLEDGIASNKKLLVQKGLAYGFPFHCSVNLTISGNFY